MNKIVKDLVEEIIEKILPSNNKSRIMISLSGIPGSGKTTLVSLIEKELSKKIKCVALSMDGFHYYKKDLDNFPNPQLAHKRRGAPFTFNVELFQNKLKEIFEWKTKEDFIFYPSFDHIDQDPKENKIKIQKDHKVIFVEGNYLCLDEPVWKDLSLYFDYVWFLECDIDVAMKRIYKRHVKAKLCQTLDESIQKTEFNDRPNAELILEKRIPKGITKFIQSISEEDENLI
ncbi:kinase-related protein [Anaeramoeba ignava]|uniref:Kinase-related protein n=1 Tax=Anaeramoeba ignava TaxID=1746090 RepID=A0A9Q0L7K0_ANAIG|nr:kinase-related protein [Anaeramoeba ignava]